VSKNRIGQFELIAFEPVFCTVLQIRADFSRKIEYGCISH
jgi:hypothetical protein